jgi:hypothetical protein
MSNRRYRTETSLGKSDLMDLKHFRPIVFTESTACARCGNTWRLEMGPGQYGILFVEAIQAAKLDQASSRKYCSSGSVRSVGSLRNSA